MAEYLTVREAAAYLKVHPQTIYKLMRNSRIWSIKPFGEGKNSRRVTTQEALDKFMESSDVNV